MAGLIGLGRQYVQQAEAASSTAAGLEARRNQENEMMRQADQAQLVSYGTQGAVIGGMAGAKAGATFGPQGAAIGAAIGLLAARLF